MYLFHLFRSFLPLHNPIGFGGSDFVEFGLVLILVDWCSREHGVCLPRYDWLAGRSGACSSCARSSSSSGLDYCLSSPFPHPPAPTTSVTSFSATRSLTFAWRIPPTRCKIGRAS